MSEQQNSHIIDVFRLPKKIAKDLTDICHTKVSLPRVCDALFNTGTISPTDLRDENNKRIGSFLQKICDLDKFEVILGSIGKRFIISICKDGKSVAVASLVSIVRGVGLETIDWVALERHYIKCFTSLCYQMGKEFVGSNILSSIEIAEKLSIPLKNKMQDIPQTLFHKFISANKSYELHYCYTKPERDTPHSNGRVILKLVRAADGKLVGKSPIISTRTHRTSIVLGWNAYKAVEVLNKSLYKDALNKIGVKDIAIKAKYVL